jgi:hypothetical protein
MPRLVISRNVLAALFLLAVFAIQFTPGRSVADESEINIAVMIKALEPLRLSVAEFRRVNSSWPSQEWAQGELKKSLETGKLAPDTLLVEDFWTDDSTFFMNLLDPVSGKNLVMTGNPDGVALESR